MSLLQPLHLQKHRRAESNQFINERLPGVILKYQLNKSANINRHFFGFIRNNLAEERKQIIPPKSLTKLILKQVPPKIDTGRNNQTINPTQNCFKIKTLFNRLYEEEQALEKQIDAKIKYEEKAKRDAFFARLIAERQRRLPPIKFYLQSINWKQMQNSFTSHQNETEKYNIGNSKEIEENSKQNSLKKQVYFNIL